MVWLDFITLVLIRAIILPFHHNQILIFSSFYIKINLATAKTPLNSIILCLHKIFFIS